MSKNRLRILQEFVVRFAKDRLRDAADHASMIGILHPTRPLMSLADLEKKVLKLRTLRSDLDEVDIIDEVNVIAAQDKRMLESVLQECISLAMAGESMPWEESHKQ